MKKITCSLMLFLSPIAMISLTGCGDEQTTSVTEGLPVSDIEAYEQKLKEMEAQASNEMADDGK
ncbi:MAG: hypothetical protein WBD31_31675 [Rubripirellula sp.]